MTGADGSSARAAQASRTARAPRTDRPPRRPPVPLPPGGGLLLVDKPTTWTSHDVVGRVRGLLRTRKVGHAGTLDPLATGLLVIAVDRSTKLLGHLALTDKTYSATIRLGASTTTDDSDGEIVAEAAASAVAALDTAGVRAAIGPLTGDLLQVPSSVSAIKVDGRRAYQRVRDGEAVELAARPVTVSRFALLAEHHDGDGHLDLEVEVDCTTGTYIRALARDLGAALGVGGHLTRLRRTRVGPFSLDGALTLPVAGPDGDAPDAGDRVAAELLAAADAVRLAFATRTVSAEEATDLGHGRSVPAAGLPGVVGVFRAGDDALIALVREDAGRARSVLGWQTAG
ncbi:tRNA pseudouridine(55) synthase TruB [Nakamurella flavida]|uniref:tRNA pseudouridine synthase B n=1 Tax=Nakamurella flavida TaxID=363630 RepID=A0A938YFQ0_9ACTN|nr:tRNA pseudouridine(55) synthase TruB [Nakamurella flavida]MBM9475042.1 tRNA pseudouridine(55) synthase TruB [Nakamurella flavida]MDP9776610.1 tRNA pseudouridine55 synthase [Nakamurella flavida]